MKCITILSSDENILLHNAFRHICIEIAKVDTLIGAPFTYNIARNPSMGIYKQARVIKVGE